MKRFSCLVYPVPFQSKPTNDEVEDIQKYHNRFGLDCQYSFDSFELSDFLTQGFTINISLLKSAKGDDFISSQLIGIDFDTDCLPIQSIIDDLKKDDLTPNFVYETWSYSNEWKKYRGVWVLDEAITDKIEYSSLIRLFIEYFGKHNECKSKLQNGCKVKIENEKEYCSNGQTNKNRIKWYPLFTTSNNKKYFIERNNVADTQCKNVNRLFHGSLGKIVYDNHNLVLNKDFLKSVCIETIKKRDSAHSERIIKGIEKKSLGEKSNLVIYNITRNEISPLDSELAQNSWLEYKDFLKDIDLQEVISTCQLFSDSLSKQLHHKETFGLITNLIFFPPDIQNIHLKSALLYDDSKKWNKAYEYVSRPQSCIDFCPYADICNPSSKLINKTFSTSDNTLSFVLNKNTKFEKQIDGMGLTRNILDFHLSKIFQNDYDEENHTFKNNPYKNKINIIEAQCGIGKTETYLQYINDNLLNNVTVCLPTHKLKNEILNRNNNIIHSINPKIVTPEIPNIPEKDIVGNLMSIGAYKTADNILSKYDDGKKFLEEKKKSLKGLSFTTHEKILIHYTKNPYIIIDEDILFKLLSIKEIHKKDIDNFNLYFGTKHSFTFNTDDIITKSRIKISKEMAEDYLGFCRIYNPSSNVLDFLSNAEIYTQKYSYVNGKKNPLPILLYLVKRDLPLDKTIVIFSATSNRLFYENLFGKDNVVFHSVPRLSNKANIIQHNKHSFSISTINRHKEIIKELTKSNIPVLTYKMISKSINHNIDFEVPYIGNLEGYDTLNDKDFDICGKAILPIEIIKLLSFVLFDKQSIIDFSKKSQTIKYKGKKKTRYFTYSNDNLKEIDLWFTHSALTQAIGRIRPLTSDKTINIYNDFPII